MRTILILTLFILVAIKALQVPQFGVYLMSWVGYMNPHRLAPWSFVYTLPLAAIAFGITVFSYLIYKNKPKNWFAPQLLLLLLLFLWSIICTYNGFYPDFAENELIRFFKIQLTILFTVILIRSREHIIYLIWVIYLSIGFYGIKGGVFTILTGGSFRVWGPEGSFIEGNNELGLALLIILPLGYFLYRQYENRWVKIGIVVSMLLMTVSVVGTHSRGAFIALVCMGIFFWLKSEAKIPIGAIIAIGLLVLIPFIPEQWYERMATITEYEQDASAMGRINAWNVAINVANERLIGGGFNFWGAETFAIYAPDPNKVHDAHSIYFEVLGELGYPGLVLFLLILSSIWFGARSNIAKVEQIDDEERKHTVVWIVHLNKMIQVSLISYMSGGAFLGLAYWDLPYHLLAITICCNNYVVDMLKEEKSSKDKRITRQYV